MQGCIVLVALLFIFIGLCYGSILFGELIAKLTKKDIRKLGSGNVGGTNVSRIIGPVWGAATMFLDAIKIYLVVITCWAIYIVTINKWAPDNHALYSLIYLGGACAVFSHCLPIKYFITLFKNHFDFKIAKNKIGGKGMAPTGGLFFSISPWLGFSIFVVWVIAFLISHYISVGSIVCPIISSFFVFIKQMDLMYLFNNNIFNNSFYFISDALYLDNLWLIISLFILLISCAILIIVRHKDNIKRLKNGTESYMPFSSKQAKKHEQKTK